MNTDLQTVTMMAGSLKAALEAAQAMVTLVGTGKARDQALKVQDEVFNAHQTALTAQVAQFALLDEKRRLEAEHVKLIAQIAEHDTWERERVRYKITRLSDGYESFGYTLKPGAEGDEDPHTLCPHCFEARKKRVLTGGGSVLGVETLKCSDCGFVAKVSRPMTSSPSVSLQTRHDVGGWMSR